MSTAGRGIAGVLLAAGAGTRFGGGKLLAPLPQPSHGVPAGTPIGVAACLHLVAALTRVIAVVRPRDMPLARALERAGAAVLECPDAHEGMGVTLAAAVKASADADGWVVALADMPWIAPATIAAIAARLGEGAQLVAPARDGRRGHPVGFARAHYAPLSTLTGDEGARSVVEAHANALELLDVDDPGVLLDVDTPGDLRGG